MSYRIVRHPAVERDIFDIVDLISDYAGTEVAFAKLAEIERSVRRLSDTPHIGTIRDDIRPGLRAIPTAQKGVLTFTVDDAARIVFIVSITYAGADWIGRLSDRKPG